MSFAVQSSSSRQPTLSCCPASFHFVACPHFIPFSRPAVHRLPIILLACGSLRAAGTLFICLRFALAIKSVPLLLFRFTPGFCKTENLQKPLRSAPHVCRPAAFFPQALSVLHPCSTRRTAREACLSDRNPFASLAESQTKLTHCSRQPAVWPQALFPSVIIFTYVYADEADDRRFLSPSISSEYSRS